MYNICHNIYVKIFIGTKSNYFISLYRRKLRERLKIASKVTIGYQIHKDVIVKVGSQTKNAYVV